MKKVLNIDYISFCISLLFVTGSCSNNDNFALETIETDFVNKSSLMLTGNRIEIGSIDIHDIVLEDSLLIIQVDNQSKFLNIYCYPSLEHIDDICMKGRARNEFNSPSNVTLQVYHDKGNIIYPFTEEDAHVKEVNITESLRKGNTVVQSVSECLERASGHFIICDENIDIRFNYYDVLYDDLSNKKCHAPRYEYVEKGRVKKTIKVYPSLCKTSNPIDVLAVYAGVMAKHPKRNLIVQPLQYMDYILFFDLDNKTSWAMHQEGSASFNDRLIDVSGNMTFTDIAMSDDYFFVLYWSGDYTVKAQRRDAAPELLVFDWFGNYQGGAKLDMPLGSIEFDNKNKVLLGYNPYEDALYSFNLADFLDGIGL